MTRCGRNGRHGANTFRTRGGGLAGVISTPNFDRRQALSARDPMTLRVWIACILLAATRAVGPAAAAEPLPSPNGLKHGVIWYAQAPDDSTLQRAARRYLVGVAGKGDATDGDKVFIKSQNPSFQWFVYNSGTDNYVVPRPGGDEEHLLLVSIANERGWNVEDAYLHYWDDTRVVLEGDTLLISGWGGGGATRPFEARIPVYNKDLSRRLVNFSTPRAAQLSKELMVQLAFGTPFDSSNLYADGIFLDNSASRLFN